MADLVSIRECARRIGVSDTAIRKAIAAGRISIADRNERNGRPLLDFDDVLKNWRANTDPAMQRTGTAGHGRMKPGALVAGGSQSHPMRPGPMGGMLNTGGDLRPNLPGDDGDPGAVDPETGEAVPPYNKSRALREHYAAQSAKLDYEKEAGTLVLAEQVRVEAFRIARLLRDAIMAVPDRIDAELAAETNARKINLRMKDELIKALGKLETDAQGAA